MPALGINAYIDHSTNSSLNLGSAYQAFDLLFWDHPTRDLDDRAIEYLFSLIPLVVY